MPRDRMQRCLHFAVVALALLGLGTANPSSAPPYPSVMMAGVLVEIGATKEALLKQFADVDAQILPLKLVDSRDVVAVQRAGAKEHEGIITFDGGRVVHFNSTWSSFHADDSAPAFAQSLIGLLSTYCPSGESLTSVETRHAPDIRFETVKIEQGATTCSFHLTSRSDGGSWVELQLTVSTLSDSKPEAP